MTYPLKFREKVFATKDKLSLTFEQTSERFDVPIRNLFRWQNKIEPNKTRNKPATKIDMEALKRDVEASPDDYQWERAQRFGVAERTIGYALKRLNICYKKKRSSIPKQTQRYVLLFKPKSVLMNRKVAPLFTWMKVVLLRTRPAHTAIHPEENVVMAFMIGMQRGVSMRLAPSWGLFF